MKTVRGRRGTGDAPRIPDDPERARTANRSCDMTAPLPDPWPAPDPTPYPSKPDPTPHPDEAPVHIINLPPDTIPPGIEIDSPERER
jgi:hypothetical protein